MHPPLSAAELDLMNDWDLFLNIKSQDPINPWAIEPIHFSYKTLIQTARGEGDEHCNKHHLSNMITTTFSLFFLAWNQQNSVAGQHDYNISPSLHPKHQQPLE